MAHLLLAEIPQEAMLLLLTGDDSVWGLTFTCSCSNYEFAKTVQLGNSTEITKQRPRGYFETLSKPYLSDIVLNPMRIFSWSHFFPIDIFSELCRLPRLGRRFLEIHNRGANSFTG